MCNIDKHKYFETNSITCNYYFHVVSITTTMIQCSSSNSIYILSIHHEKIFVTEFNLIELNCIINKQIVLIYNLMYFKNQYYVIINKTK